MEIKWIGEKQIRCALTEAEIQEMGYDIDEIIGDTETTQKFMKGVLQRIEEQEQVNLDEFSPLVRAELLQDHSMAITFGGETEVSFQDLVDKVSSLMQQIEPGKLEKLRRLANQEKKETVSKDSADDEVFHEKMPFMLEFGQMEDVIRMSRLFKGKERMPQSTLYKLEKNYYLIMDFIHFSKEELRPLAFAAVEYDHAHFADTAKAAYVMEHGKCIVKKQALETLMQL